jgi:hypothetical protein
MNGLALLPDWGIGEVALSVIAVLLFALAVATGRWALWLIGYLAVLAALALALVAGWAHRPEPFGAGPPPTTAAQPFAGSGVLDDATRFADLTMRACDPNGTV